MHVQNPNDSNSAGGRYITELYYLCVGTYM